MKQRTMVISLLAVFLAGTAVLMLLAAQDTDGRQDAVWVNEAVQSVQMNWDRLENHENQTDLDYVVIDMEGAVRFRTGTGLSESINEAVIHRDTILDIHKGGTVVGKIIIYNVSPQIFGEWKRTVLLVCLAAMASQCIICIGYMIYLQKRIVQPFQKLKGFAERIAGGSLDVPLEMDRKNLFGAFTESFDIMRSELKKARLAEAKANEDKKELVARLSHDIKTPVASIKAVSEVGAALTDDEKLWDNYAQIIRKADQINTLITNLFTAALEELQQLTVTPVDMGSRELKALLDNADYLHRAEIPDIPDCMIYADKLRLQQVFDNIFANSYKYAGTEIVLSASVQKGYLAVSVEDYGGGVSEEELPHIKKKFRRGTNTEGIEGAGLGLYISDYFMQEMKGELDVQNGKKGLKAAVRICLGGVV